MRWILSLIVRQAANRAVMDGGEIIVIDSTAWGNQQWVESRAKILSNFSASRGSL